MTFESGCYDATSRAYCLAHRTAKRLLGRSSEPKVSFFHCYTEDDAVRFLSCRDEWERSGSPAVNDDTVFPRCATELFFGENVVDGTCFPRNDQTPDSSVCAFGAFDSPEEAWRGFVRRSIVPDGWRNAGLHTVCWSKRRGQWSLSSWIWTSAALARYYVVAEDRVNLRRVADALLGMQLPEGGWVVRHDFVHRRTTPMIAPNDSAYIASNALICAYESLGDRKYLDGAERCARWIILTSQSDGLVYIGQNGFTGEWISESNIVDIGFTAGLFAGLVRLTGKAEYRDFLTRFVEAYVTAFRNPQDGSFATAINGRRERLGGTFARGQAWALEGLVPASQVLSSSLAEEAANGVIRCLLASQRRDGGWAYNLSHPFMGEDCKGVSVIAKSLAEWGAAHEDSAALKAAARALDWCRSHTSLSGPGAGGIFSYCLEGCVTHDLYSEAAFVYSSSYALETSILLEGSK